ncbi:hypothetical protein GCM10007979_00750 [Nocardioides albus]|nr:hypothetical protein GCM10007979_00750 [Nocardioides albus]
MVTVGAMLAVVQRPDVYSTRVDVIFVAPQEWQATDPSILSTSNGLIAFVGLIERMVNSDRTGRAETSRDVSLVGMGERDGVLIRLPNSGGQWNYNFNAPTLSVHVAGSGTDEVVEAREAAVDDIFATLATLQHGLPDRNRVTARAHPRRAPVLRMAGHRGRAAGAVAVVGTVLTCAAAVGLDQLRKPRRDRN